MANQANFKDKLDKITYRGRSLYSVLSNLVKVLEDKKQTLYEGQSSYPEETKTCFKEFVFAWRSKDLHQVSKGLPWLNSNIQGHQTTLCENERFGRQPNAFATFLQLWPYFKDQFGAQSSHSNAQAQGGRVVFNAQRGNTKAQSNPQASHQHLPRHDASIGKSASQPTSRRAEEAPYQGPTAADVNKQSLRAVQELQETNQQLQDTNAVICRENEELRKEKQRLLETISELMSTKISSNEQNFENINDPCRPTVVTDEFKRLCSYEWLEAKQELDRQPQFKDDFKCRLLCSILVEASWKARETVQSMYDSIRDTLFWTLSKDQKKDKTPMPEEIRIALSKHFKLRAERINLEEITKAVIAKIQSQESVGRAMWTGQTPALNRYTNAATIIAWKMAIQLPQMAMHVPNRSRDTFSSKYHEPHMGSPEPKEGSQIAYYVYPMIYHGDIFLAKAKVVIFK